MFFHCNFYLHGGSGFGMLIFIGDILSYCGASTHFHCKFNLQGGSGFGILIFIGDTLSDIVVVDNARRSCDSRSSTAILASTGGEELEILSGVSPRGAWRETWPVAVQRRG